MRFLTSAFALFALATAAHAQIFGTSQPKPEYYGVYALQDGKLTRLEAKSTNQLQAYLPAPVFGITKQQPSVSFPNGKLQFVFYKRDYAVSAPDSIFVSILSRLTHETVYGWNHKLERQSAISGVWHARDRGYNFLVSPYGDTKEAILVRHTDPNFVFPSGRYLFIVGQEYYDFSVAGPVTDPEHCEEAIMEMATVKYEQCSMHALPPPAAAPSGADPLTFVKLDDTNFNLERQYPAVYASYQKIVPVEYRAAPWVFKLYGTSGPIFRVTVEGRPYFGQSVCKPHDCADNRLSFLAAEDGSRAVMGILFNSQMHGMVRYIGNPTAWEVTALRQIDEGRH